MREDEFVLSLKNIEKNFAANQVLKGVSLDVAKGEFITLLGQSGCGKTTLLRIIAGLESADGGSVILSGQDVTALPPERRNVNTVFQSYALFPHMNVEQNIAYGQKLRKVPKEEIRKKVKSMLELVRMEGYERRTPDKLSGGQRQRIAIARAIINNPDILLLDEPLGALDLKLRQHMQGELKRIQRETGVTFVYVTHDQDEALNMSDRIAVMNEGVLEQVGTPREVYDTPRTLFAAGFIGDRNIFRIKDGGFDGFKLPNQNDGYLAVLSDKMHISHAPFYECCLSGTVLERRYAGSITKTVVEVKGQNINVAEYQAAEGISRGDSVYLCWDEKDGVYVDE